MAVVESAEAGLAAAAAGATVLQLRAPGLEARRLLAEARELVESSPVPVVVSSRLDVAALAGAAGANLPERDLPLGEARRLLGPDRWLGRSVHDAEGARRAEAEGADYVIFGPVLATPTHSETPARGLATLAEVARAVAIPVLGIGGLDRSRLDEVLATGAAGYAAIRGFQP